MAFMLMWYWTLTGCRYLEKWVTYSLEALRCIFCSACVCSNKFFVRKVSKSPLVLHCFCACCLCFGEIKGLKTSRLLLAGTHFFNIQVRANLLVPCPCICLCSHKVPLPTQDGSKWKWGLNSSWYQFTVALYWFHTAGWFPWAALPCHYCEREPPCLCD